MSQKTLVWFRQDLRLSHNPALFEAAQKGPIMAVYIWDKVISEETFGEASRWWLYHSLKKLSSSLQGKLHFYKGSPSSILHSLIKKYDLQGVYWNRCYEPARIQQDGDLKSYLKTQGLEVKSFQSSLLWEPWEILKPDKTPYRVFTPFSKACFQGPLPDPLLPVPNSLQFLEDPEALPLDGLHICPQLPWTQSLEPHWTIGEKGAHQRWSSFLKNGLKGYKEGRNFPAESHGSRLSPHLHFGEIAPHHLWWDLQEILKKDPFLYEDSICFLKELIWREFSYSLLYHFPQLPSENFQKKFDLFPWKTKSNFNEKELIFLKAWQKGQTGYPLIDAGMRELWSTGFMHNRVRMAVASFLVKNLGVHWREGAQWFLDCLVDADLANNSASWQWVAGSGVDAAPYFRIFNPISQGEKFDPEGVYTKRFVPELKNCPLKYLFKPWEAPSSLLKKAGITLGETYPFPIIDFKTSREKTLQAFTHHIKRDV